MFKKLILVFCLVLALCLPAYAQTVQKVLTFGWQETLPTPNDLASFKLYWSSTAGGVPGGTGVSLVGTIPYAALVPPATEYTSNVTITIPSGVDVTKYFFMTAVDTAGNESAKSNEVSQFFNITAPAIPSTLIVLSSVGNTVTFGWNQVLPTNPADMGGWKLYQSLTSGGPWSLIATVPYVSSQTQYTTAQTIAAPANTVTTIYFVLASYDTANNLSGYSNQVSKQFDLQSPSVPMSLTIKAVASP